MEVGLSLGSNLGDRLAQLRKARDLIVRTRGVTAVAQSPVYETEPFGVSPEDSSLFFLNAVLIIETSLLLSGLLTRFRQIERQLGRARRTRPNAPRPIDIDIIYAGDLRVSGEDVTVPHPRWAERRFVVQPLSDVRPDLKIPGETGTVAEVLRKLSDKHKVTLFAEEF
jgi:2-amino-4-hydroxy-6-hydroxymethyldihydropteridine diphosphokinase